MKLESLLNLLYLLQSTPASPGDVATSPLKRKKKKKKQQQSRTNSNSATKICPIIAT